MSEDVRSDIDLERAKQVYSDFVSGLDEETREELAVRKGEGIKGYPLPFTDDPSVCQGHAKQLVAVLGRNAVTRVETNRESVWLESFLSCGLNLLGAYFAGNDCNVAGLLRLASLLRDRSPRYPQAFDLMVRQVELGLKKAPSGEDVPSKFRRNRDHICPYDHVKPTGERGFSAEDDSTVWLYERMQDFRTLNVSEFGKACLRALTPLLPLCDAELKDDFRASLGEIASKRLSPRTPRERIERLKRDLLAHWRCGELEVDALDGLYFDALYDFVMRANVSEGAKMRRVTQYEKKMNDLLEEEFISAASEVDMERSALEHAVYIRKEA